MFLKFGTLRNHEGNAKRNVFFKWHSLCHRTLAELIEFVYGEDVQAQIEF